MRNPKSEIRNVIFALLAGLLLFAMPVYAQEGGETAVTDDEVNEVAKDLFCPVCESTPLDVCATQACADWRELIRTKLGEGETKEEIFDYFARQYGDGVLARPPQRGFNLLLWFFPVVAVLLGGALFFRYVQNLQAARDEIDGDVEMAEGAIVAKAKQPAATIEDYISQVEAELNDS